MVMADIIVGNLDLADWGYEHTSQLGGRPGPQPAADSLTAPLPHTHCPHVPDKFCITLTDTHYT